MKFEIFQTSELIIKKYGNKKILDSKNKIKINFKFEF